MAQPLPREVLDSAVDPANVSQQKFDTERRGFDQRQVRAYLIAVADALRDAQRREAEIRTRLGKAIRRAETAERVAREPATVDEGALTKQLGDEVAAVLDAARAAGDQRVAAAEKSAEQLLANAKVEADEARRMAGSLVERRRGEAQAAADELLAKARGEADAMLQEARDEAKAVRDDARRHLARARDHGDTLIKEAEEARRQILADMDRRRRQARAQVERLRVGRDRLLRSYEVVRRTLDETTVELKSSLKEAKVRGDTAARSVRTEPLSSSAQLEVEITEARRIGMLSIDESLPSRPTMLRPPAVAPTIKPSEPIEDDEGDPVPPELVAEDDEGDGPPTEEVEPVVDLTGVDHDTMIDAPPTSSTDDGAAADGLFDALRAETGAAPDDDAAVADDIDADAADPGPDMAVEMANQRQAIIVESSSEFERRLGRALVDEQNEMLAGIRAANKGKRKRAAEVDLMAILGDVDAQLQRYVVAISEMAVVAYGAGAALVDEEVPMGEMPAGAVEELLTERLLTPLRARLESLDAARPTTPSAHLDALRACYRESKAAHLEATATELAALLCTAGACDALPPDVPIPWASPAAS